MAKIKDLLVQGQAKFLRKTYFQDQIISNVADGTAPMVVASTTKVANLNADYLDGYHANGLFTSLSSTSGTNLSISIGGKTLTTSIYATDSDKLDGLDASAFVTALGTSGNYLTWTRNSTVNNITVPYATNCDTVDSHHATKFGMVYNSSNVGNTSSVTVNDMISSGGSNATFAMIYSATDNPTGSAQWIHVWSQSWSINSASNWVSQIALGTSAGNGMWYRCSSGAAAGLAWKRIIDSSNIGSQSVAYATSAGDADTVDGYHINQTYRVYTGGFGAHGGSARWFCVYDMILSSANNATSTFMVTGTHSYAGRWGIFVLSSRQDNGSPNTMYFDCILNVGLDLSHFTATYKTESGKVRIKLYVYSTGWTAYEATRLSYSGWGYPSTAEANFYNAHDTTSGVSSLPPSGETIFSNNNGHPVDKTWSKSAGNADTVDGYHKTDLIGALTKGSWNPRSTTLAMDWYYNGGDFSVSESGGQISISIDGFFWQNEGQYKVIDENSGDARYVNVNGDTMTGQLIMSNVPIWVQSSASYGGTSNRMSISAGNPAALPYTGSSTGKVGTMIFANGIAFRDPYWTSGTYPNDSCWIRHIEETNNTGYMEIAVGDDASNENIYFRAYNTSSAITHSFLTMTSSNGYVGINNNSPGYRLDVNGTGHFNGSVRIDSSYPHIDMYSTGAESSVYFRPSSGTSWALGKAPWGVGGFGIGILNDGCKFTILDNGNTGVGTTSPGYKLQISGDSYTTGWCRAGSGFYIENTGVHFTSYGSVGEIDVYSNNEFLWGSSGSTLYFNYRGVSRGTTVTNYIWNAGSSSSYATHTTGAISIRGTTDAGQYSQGGYNKAYSNIVLYGDNTYGISGITFLSMCGNGTSINTPSDVAFIQYHPHGVTASAYNTTPSEASSGERARFVIGVGNDADNGSSDYGEELWLQTAGANDLKHYVVNAGYTILDANNYTDYTVTKTGGGASGTWGINISGTATYATYASHLNASYLNSSSSWSWNPFSVTQYWTWGENFYNSSISSDTGDIRFYICGGTGGGTALCVNIDGYIATLSSIYAGGNMYAAHYYENSDLRLKTKFEKLDVSINSIANLPVFNFSWKSDLSSRNSGTSAQEVQKILPNIVTKSGEDSHLTLDYGVLGTVSSIIVAREVLQLKEEIRQLKQKLGITE